LVGILDDLRPERSASLGFLCRHGRSFAGHLALIEAHRLIVAELTLPSIGLALPTDHLPSRASVSI
jgi:hypothetical protein